MAKKIMQFRYYGEGDSNNFPENISMSDLMNNGAFKDYVPFSQLGIQSLPGTKFYLNGALNSITIGVSGILDLDIKNGSRVTDLRFTERSLRRVASNPAAYLIVDIIYGED